MDLVRLILYRAITRQGRSNSLHLSGDNPALTFIQEPVLGARERCGSPRRVGLNCQSPRLAGSICIVSSADGFLTPCVYDSRGL